MTAQRVVVAGTGLAGFTVAQTLRSGGFAGEIVMVGQEPHRPYDRPPLSKGFLVGELTMADLAYETDESRLDVTWRLGVAAVGLDVANRALLLGDGSTVGGDELVIATGGRPRPFPGALTLGSVADAERLRPALAPGADVVVLGSGFIGLEVAATATQLGAEVTVVCEEDSPLDRVFGAEASASIRGIHERAGVRFVPGVQALEIVPDGDRKAVVLSDGRRLSSSVVIAGVGSAPATSWLATSDLELSPFGAIICDERGVAAPGIRATGDCASWSGAPCRHWTLAKERAARVAHDILEPGSGQESGDLEYVWSDQHGVRLQFAGTLHEGAVPTVESGGIDTGDVFLVYRTADGTEVAAFGMNQLRPMMRWRKTHRRRSAGVAA